jgi:hypothetical protein
VIVRPLAPFLPSRSTPRRAAAPRRRAARTAVLWAAFVLLVAHLGMALAVETVAPHVRDPEYGYRQYRVLALQKAHPDRPLVLVMGTSRVQNGIDPSVMGFADEPGSPVVFNGGLSGTFPIHLWLNYHRYRDAGVRPAALLVELFPPLVSVPGPPDALFTETAPRLSYADLRRLEPYLADPALLRRRWALDRANSWHALRPVVVAHLGRGWQLPQSMDRHRLAVDTYGFTRFPYDVVPDEYRAEKRGAMERGYAPAVRTLSVSDLTDRAYRNLVADCRAEGIPVAFFLTPESPVFRSWYSPESRAAVEAFCRMLREELSCPVFEAPQDFAETDFADGHHMLPPAARRYSRALADRHLKPWLAEVLK